MKNFFFVFIVILSFVVSCKADPVYTGDAASRAEQILKTWEGLRLDVYKDVAGVATIGYGSTKKDLTDKGTITETEALTQLRADIVNCRACVEKAVTVKLTESQKAALISFVYNVGGTNFRKSTLLKELNAGNYAEVPNQLRRWKYAGGKVVQGLINRREAEIRLWNTKD